MCIPAAPGMSAEHPGDLRHQGGRDSKHVAGEDWHSDVSCDAEPPMGSILYLTEIPPDGGGDTLFANMYLAYETLSEPIRKLIDGMTAIHDGAPYYRERYTARSRQDLSACRAPGRAHAPGHAAGRCLFVNRMFTTRIVGVGKSESDAILEMLWRHIETPELSVRFKWQPNSIAFWDNRCVQHRAVWDYYPNRRYGHRVTVCGDKPY